MATVLALSCPAPATAQTAPDCDTTGNSEILRTGKPITAECRLLRRRRRHGHADPLHAGARHAERAKLKVKLTGKARKALKKARSVKLTVRAGAVTKRVTVKR